MSCPRQVLICLAALFFAWAAAAQSTDAVSVAVTGRTNAASTASLTPPLPQLQSPINYFRQLLLMSPAERTQSLAGRTAAARARILAKVREYQALAPNERELRLRATELRWYLMPLLRLAPAERAGQLAQMPSELRDLAQSRLTQWDLLPPALQQEFLTNDRALHYLAQTPPPPLPDTRQQEIAKQFDDFLALTEPEKARLLGVLSDAERVRMEQTLDTFNQLPPQQRIICIHNYAKFAGMNGAARAEFLKNAESWSKMSPQERQAWRDLVAHVPLWPPVPTAPPPIPPQMPSRPPRTSMATD